MRIDRERGCYRISFESRMDLTSLQRRIGECAERVDGLITSGELLREGESYVLCIRHRESLKEYLEHQIFDLTHFIQFLRRLRIFLECLQKQHLPIYDCIWDVDCIFVGNDIEELELVYIPEICGCPEEGSMKTPFRFSDMLAVVSLRVYETEIPALQMLSEVIGDFSKWEDEVLLKGSYSDVPFLEGERKLLLFCQDQNRLIRGFRKAFEVIRSQKSERSDALTESPGVPRGSSRLYLEGTGLLKGRKVVLTALKDLQEGDSFVVGRETDFASMLLPYPVVSRRQATISYRRGQWFLTDEDSVNGTFLDEIPMTPGTGYPLARGHCFFFAHRKIGFRVRKLS